MVEERMRSSGCFPHWLATGMASSSKTLHQLLHHEMYFPSTPLPFSWLKRDGIRGCEMFWSVLRGCTAHVWNNWRWKVKGDWLTRVHIKGWDGQGDNWLTQGHVEGWLLYWCVCGCNLLLRGLSGVCVYRMSTWKTRMRRE